jgi:hypothetical protein
VILVRATAQSSVFGSADLFSYEFFRDWLEHFGDHVIYVNRRDTKHQVISRQRIVSYVLLAIAVRYGSLHIAPKVLG